MKLYLKQKAISIRDKYNLFNEKGELIYQGQQKLASMTRQLRVTKDGYEVIRIKKRFFTLHNRYVITINGEQSFTMHKKIFRFTPQFRIDQLGWEISGDFFALDFEIVHKDELVLTCHKKFISFGDSYEIDIIDQKHELIAIAAVLVIDMIQADVRRKRDR